MNEEQPGAASAPTDAAGPAMTQGQQEAAEQAKATEDWQKHKNIAMVSRIFFLFWLPFVHDDAKASPYVMFHANQGLLLCIVFAVAQLIMMTPGIGMLAWVVQLAVLAFTVIGVLQASKGEMKPLPFIGHLVFLK